MSKDKRCAWAGTDARMIAYHDDEWGVPVHDDRRFFEFLVLEGAQAGLSWKTILEKREGYREAFEGFDPAKVARFDRRRVEKLLQNPQIVRNRLKVESSVTNAAAFVAVQREFGSFDRFVWTSVVVAPRISRWRRAHDVPASTPDSDALSKTLKRLASVLSGRRSAMRSCRRPAWSTTTWSTASVTRVGSADPRRQGDGALPATKLVQNAYCRVLSQAITGSAATSGTPA
jgi:DNA-3-methyladenine glycosylase I